MFVVYKGKVCVMVKRNGRWVYIPEKEYRPEQEVSFGDTPL